VADVTTSLESVGVLTNWYGFLLGAFYHFAHGDDTPGKVAKEPMVMEFCRQFNVPVTGKHPELPVSSDVLGKTKTILQSENLDFDSLVLIHTGPSWSVKEWPQKNWNDLVLGLRAAGFSNIAQLGIVRYMDFGEIGLGTTPGTVSLIGRLSLEECIAAISLARLFIGIDSGLLHIAASTRTPSVGIFGSTLPKYFYTDDDSFGFAVSRVECVGCYHRLPRVHWLTGCPNDIQCMKTIGVEEVLPLCLQKLNPLLR